VDVQPIPGLEHEPYAEVWFHAIDEDAYAEASSRARSLAKTGLEAWTTTRTPGVAVWLREKGYEEVRRYVISELDVASAPEPAPPRFELTTLASRPDLADSLFELARDAYPDQPGRAGSRVDEEWYEWGLRAHAAEAYFIALEDGEVLGYGFLGEHDGVWSNGFMAVARAARGRGVAGAIKRAQIAWAREQGIRAIRTANEVRLASMLDLNRRLGYVPLHEEIVLRGPLAP
jgi:mycothiol synthase